MTLKPNVEMQSQKDADSGMRKLIAVATAPIEAGAELLRDELLAVKDEQVLVPKCVLPG